MIWRREAIGRLVKNIEMSLGESLKVIRKLQEMTQKEQSKTTGIAQATISAIERDRINLGIEHAKALLSSPKAQ